jgi:NADPH:quinone reductase-like Zn-dependent oxidoreductase
VKPITRTRYGTPDVLRVDDVAAVPEPAPDGVVIRVRAASVNRVDWYDVTGRPWIARPMTGLRGPKSTPVGGDFAGTVEAVGEDVADLEPGDEVFGIARGSFAEYAGVKKAAALKPANVSFEDAAAVPVAGLTALQGLRDHGGLEPGQNVLVNGASGGVGTFAVQIAKALGAEVTAVCSTRNVDHARSLGADHVIDYTRGDFTKGSRRYDLMLDIAGSKSWRHCGRVLTSDGRLVIVGGEGNPLIGPLGHIAATWLAALPGKRNATFFVANLNRADLEFLGELLDSGRVKPVIEKRYELAEVPEALRYMGEGHARGKLVITV